MILWILTPMGIAASLAMGHFELGWSWTTCVLAIVLANVGGYLGMVLTLQAERVSWIKKNFLPSTLPTWSFFLVVYFAPQLLGIEEMRNAEAFVRMLFPLMFSNGFSIAAFGPTQDFFVRHSQRKSMGIVGPIRLKAKVRAELKTQKAVFLTLAALGIASPLLAEPAPKKLPGQLATVMTPEELEREKQDEKRFPNVMRFIKSIDVAAGVVPSDPRNAQWVKSTHVFQPKQSMWNGFWKAAAQDKITCLRAFALIARNIKKHGMIVFGPGKDFENSVVENHIDLGLAMPASHIGTGIWSPDPTNPDPEFQLHLKIFYTEQFIHKFPDNILEANLKIGYGPEETYFMNGQEYKQHTVDTDIYYGPKGGIGFKNVKGIGGQKRGFMGVLQAVLFFIPDAISGMMIVEDKNQLLTVASMDTRVDEFETNPLYSIKVMDPAAASHDPVPAP